VTSIRLCAAGLLLASLLATGGCGDTPEVPASGAGAASAADPASALLADSWMHAAAHDPVAVMALLDAPGGDGWLDLFHGDLAHAKPAFEAAESASARLGLARVHLDRAATMRSAARLHREVALDLVRYRRDHADQIRAGAYEPLLALLVARSAGAEGGELAAFDAASLRPPAAHADPAVVAALRGLLDGGDPNRTLGTVYPARLAFIAAVNQGDLGLADELILPSHRPDPDLIDPLGEDVEAGLTFTARFYDPRFASAVARYHLARAWGEGSALEGPGPTIAAAVEGGWGGPLPESVRNAATPAPPGEALPEWTALFASTAVDRADWDAQWGESGSAFADRWGAADRGVDATLQALADAETSFAVALKDGAPADGAALVDELSLAQPVIDRVLRSRMVAVTGTGEDAEARVLCKRYGDRSVDPNPGSRGGAADSARTRVSWRNDRAFLLDYARCLWRAGQPGGALDFVHPLATEDPALQSVRHYLGQLDAAASIGLQGKTSQL